MDCSVDLSKYRKIQKASIKVPQMKLTEKDFICDFEKLIDQTVELLTPNQNGYYQLLKSFDNAEVQYKERISNEYSEIMRKILNADWMKGKHKNVLLEKLKISIGTGAIAMDHELENRRNCTITQMQHIQRTKIPEIIIKAIEKEFLEQRTIVQDLVHVSQYLSQIINANYANLEAVFDEIRGILDREDTQAIIPRMKNQLERQYDISFEG